MNLLRKLLVIVIMIIPQVSPEAYSQLIPGTGQSQEEEVPEIQEDRYGRQTPRSTVRGFISSVADQDYQRASHFLNLPEEADGVELARVLQKILDHGNLLSYAQLSDEVEGYTEDDLPPDIDRVGSVEINGKNFNVTVQQVTNDEGTPIWLFSTETVQHIATIDVDDVLFIDSLLPPVLKENSWAGSPVGHWLAVLLLLPLSYYLARIITSLVALILRKSWPRASTEPTSGIIEALILPIKLYLAGWLFVYTTEFLGISIVLRQRFSGLMVILGILAFIILLWRLAAFLGNFSKDRMVKRGSASGVSIVLFLQRAARVTIVILGVIAILSVVGIDVTAGLAALGIGGIALALGAQKSMENLVGSVTLIADQPIRVGDFCKVGDVVGTVESIGMRSTRIRTLSRTVVTIPNGEFSSSRIENYAHRDRFWFHPILNLRYETTPDQMRFLLVELRSVLYSHEKVSPDPARIRFIELGSASLNMEIFAYVMVETYDEFLEVQEDLLLRIMDVVEESGSGFAFPSQTIYFAKDSGLSENKTSSAEEKVKKWRENNDLQMPQFSPERIDQLRNTIPFPPEGSVQREKESAE